MKQSSPVDWKHHWPLEVFSSTGQQRDLKADFNIGEIPPSTKAKKRLEQSEFYESNGAL